MTILNEEVIYSNGCLRRVKRWVKGWVPGINGKFIVGLTGRETEVVLDIVVASHIFEVTEIEQTD